MKQLLFFLQLPVLLCTSCDLKKMQSDHGVLNIELSIVPSKGSPGETVLLVMPQSESDSLGVLLVYFGKTPATIIRADNRGNLLVLVPMSADGKTSVSLSKNGQKVGKTAFEILPPTARQLVLQLDDSGGDLEMLSDQPYSGGYNQGFSTPTFQLSYDLMSDNGNLLFSSSIPNPAKQGMEVFENPDGTGIHREAKVGISVFSINIPNLGQAATIRFYEAQPGVDLSSVEGRMERKFLREIKL